MPSIVNARQLSPLRNTTAASSIEDLVDEQLRHFAIDPASAYGQTLARLTHSLYEANAAAHELVALTGAALSGLDRKDRVAWFNAKRFACFQLAKMLDTLQTPMRRTYQSLAGRNGPGAARGPYPIFDNVTAIFSATPVITRTATYLYACVEWVEDAFKGKELLHEIYSRLLNPDLGQPCQSHRRCRGRTACTSNISPGTSTPAWLPSIRRWPISSGTRISCSPAATSMAAAINCSMTGTASSSNLDIAVNWFDGFTVEEFSKVFETVKSKYADRIAAGRHVYVYLESPCNPHGHVLDVAAICRAAHEAGLTVICDSTVGTPFLHPVLRRENPAERPDFVIHSYTKDLAGYGATTAGVVIARNELMFLPKGSKAEMTLPDGKTRTVNWDETLFWNVYYIKGAFLDADKAYEVINGMRTLELAHAVEMHHHHGVWPERSPPTRGSMSIARLCRAIPTLHFARRTCSSAFPHHCSPSTLKPRSRRSNLCRAKPSKLSSIYLNRSSACR